MKVQPSFIAERERERERRKERGRAALRAPSAAVDYIDPVFAGRIALEKLPISSAPFLLFHHLRLDTCYSSNCEQDAMVKAQSEDNINRIWETGN